MDVRAWCLLALLCLAGCQRTASEAPRFGRYTIAASAPQTEVQAGVKAQVLLAPERTGDARASLVLLEVELAHFVDLHRHEGSELLFFLEGGGQLLGAAQVTINALEGAWIPGGVAHGFQANARSRVLALYTPSGPEQRHLGKTDPGTAAVEEAVARAGAEAPVIFRPGTSAALKIAGGAGVVRLGLEAEQTPVPPASCALLELQPGASVPDHHHAGEAELLYIFEGEGLMRIDGREEKLTAPVALWIAPGVDHAVTVTSERPLRAVQWYTPPGPEQRFKGK